MLDRSQLARVIAVAIVLMPGSGVAASRTTVNYGRITSVNLVSDQNRGAAQTSGAILGGVLGASVGGNRSGASRVLGGAGGAFAGRQLGRMATQRQAFEYTILIEGKQSITMVTDEAGMRVGDCVAVERGGYNNLRLVDESRCAPNAKPTQSEMNQAIGCERAKEQLLEAQTDEEFDRAERRVRLLCVD